MVTKDRNTFIVLGALTLIFLGRVVAQLIQYLYPIANLPPFDAWQSGALSYGWLLFSQIIILSIQITVLMKIHKGTYVFYKTKLLILKPWGNAHKKRWDFFAMLQREHLNI